MIPNLSSGMVSFGDQDLQVGTSTFHDAPPNSHIVSGGLSTQMSSFQFMNMDVKKQHNDSPSEVSGPSSNRERATTGSVWHPIPAPNTPTRNDASNPSFSPMAQAPSASTTQQFQPPLVPGYNRRNTTGGPAVPKPQSSQSSVAHRRSLQTLLHNDNGVLWGANGKTTPVKEDRSTRQSGQAIFFGPEFGSSTSEFLDPLVTAGSPWNDSLSNFATSCNVMTPSIMSRTSRFFPSPISDQRKDFFQGGLSGTAAGVFTDPLVCPATSSVRSLSDEVNLDLNLGIIDTEEPFKAQHVIDKLSRFSITSVSEYLLNEHSDIRLVTQSQNEWEDEQEEYDDDWETVSGSLELAVAEFSNMIVSLPPRGLTVSASSSVSSLSSSSNSDSCAEAGLESVDVTSYIKKIITRQQETHVTYIASLSHSAKPQFEKLIQQVFRNYGDILRIEDEPSTNNDFVKFKVFTRLNNGKGPYKIFKFINERTQREEKMLFFFESNSGGTQNSGYGVSAGSNSSTGSTPSKNDVNTYPEGFSSTFHKRGINNFMFVRELQSKMIVNKSAKTNSEYGEFRISLPVHRILGGTKFTKKSFIVNIDLREYESKGYNNDKAKHFKSKFSGR
ncbi:hypothetical protein LJB42_001627 [Komagataella kurtzmanii]|nr:hypothetical protein LJB42_001627 [Komagataella kurtzmanii]